MKSLGTIKEFAKAQGFSAVSKVRENASGYKFVTFIKTDKDGNALPDGAENIYLSIGLAEETEVGAKLDRELPMNEVQNAQGELRVKICSAGGDYDAI